MARRVRVGLLLSTLGALWALGACGDDADSGAPPGSEDAGTTGGSGGSSGSGSGGDGATESGGRGGATGGTGGANGGSGGVDAGSPGTGGSGEDASAGEDARAGDASTPDASREGGGSPEAGGDAADDGGDTEPKLDDCFPLSVTLSGNATTTSAALRGNTLLFAFCPLLYTGSTGQGPFLIRFSHDASGYSLSATTGNLPIVDVSAGTLVRAASYNGRFTNDSVTNIPEDTDVTITTRDGDVIVLAFSGEELTIKSWTESADPDPSEVSVAGACLDRTNSGAGAEPRFRILFDGTGLYENATVEMELDVLRGEPRDADGGEVLYSESFDVTLDPAEIDREGRATFAFGVADSNMDFPWWAQMTVTSLTLVTEAGGTETRTDILADFNATLGQQFEVDLLQGDILTTLLPVGEYQVHVGAHDDAPEVILGDCTPPYWNE